MAFNGGRRSLYAAARQENTEPVSSILTTHFAPHLAYQGSQTHRVTRETFSQLQQELLGGRYSQPRLHSNITDVNKLVSIVLNAGLEPGFEENSPSKEGFKDQVLDCLDIIQSVIEKVPQSLSELSNPEPLREGVHAPLYAWLVLRLIGLCGAWDSEDVRIKASDVFSSMAYCQLKQFRPWPRFFSIPALLQICTSG